ncbi:hypothetical protein M2390_000322 [Mycetocola sp. BIGb0189]|nr:hypothetical protein [Mycetocola sp. BIGb0189]
MAIDITYRKLCNQAILEGSGFLELYKRISLGMTLSGDEYQELLSYAVNFFRKGDSTVKRLGYRIALQYSIDTANTGPTSPRSTRASSPRASFIASTWCRIHPVRDGS